MKKADDDAQVALTVRIRAITAFGQRGHGVIHMVDKPVSREWRPVWPNPRSMHPRLKALVISGQANHRISFKPKESEGAQDDE